MTLRPHQKEMYDKAHRIMIWSGFVYIAGQMRVGKTIVALELSKRYNDTLIVTKKKAISSIEKDMKLTGTTADVINYESLHKIERSYKCMIIDEAHSIGAFPKPCKALKELRRIARQDTVIIYLSGTPSPESYSQLYHQFSIVRNPFKTKNFYAWAKEYVNIKQRNYGYGLVNDYSDADKEKINKVIGKYFVSCTQEEAGFQAKIDEKVITIPTPNVVKEFARGIMKDKVYGNIIAETAVKQQGKVHQIFSGSVIDNDGNVQILSDYKAQYIKQNFPNHIAIFTKYAGEKDIIRATFDNLTEDPEEFNSDPNKTFVGQIQSVMQGVNLVTAEALVYYNIDFSALAYIQGRERASNYLRKENSKVYFIFSDGGIEHEIYKRVINKQDYTNYYFKKWSGTINEKSSNRKSQRAGM